MILKNWKFFQLYILTIKKHFIIYDLFQ